MQDKPHRERADALRIALAHRPQSRAHKIEIIADAPWRERLATEAGATSVAALSLEGMLEPAGRRGWRLSAKLTAEALQPCVASLRPVKTAVDAAITRHFVTEVAPVGGGEHEMPDDIDTEPLPEVLDLEEIILEELVLALPDFPRHPDVAPADIEARPEGSEPLAPRENPFAILAKLKSPGDAENDG